MIIKKTSLSRRTVLRGFGVALGLPFLDSMVPAFCATAPRRTRLSVVYSPNGMMMDKWTPSVAGAAYQLTPTLEPLASLRDRFVILSGLTHLEARALPGEAGGDHARASSSFLTGVHAKKTEGADQRVGTSLDQIVAQELGKETQLASLELAVDPIGSCETGYSCAYTNTISWRSPTTPMPMEYVPRAVFERLFGDNDTTDPAVRLVQQKDERSILDFVVTATKRLQSGLGNSDQAKLSDYLDAIRDVERRIQVGEKQQSTKLPELSRPVGVPETFEEHAKLMYDLQVLAYQTDMTRVTTFMLGHEQTTRSYAEIGVPEAHHPVSHHGGNATKKAQVAAIDKHHVKLFGYFLGRLASTPDGDGSLLDHSIVLYGSGLSDGNMHTHDNLPLLLAGGGSGKIKGGRHLRFQNNAPMPALYGTLLNALDIPIENLETEAGRLEPLTI